MLTPAGICKWLQLEVSQVSFSTAPEDVHSNVSNKRAGRTGASDVVVRVVVLIEDVLSVLVVLEVLVSDVVPLLLVVDVADEVNVAVVVVLEMVLVRLVWVEVVAVAVEDVVPVKVSVWVSLLSLICSSRGSASALSISAMQRTPLK